MTGEKGMRAAILIALAAAFISGSLTLWFTADYYGKMQIAMLSHVTEKLAEGSLEQEQRVLVILKELVREGKVNADSGLAVDDAGFLSQFGYEESDFDFLIRVKPTFTALVFLTAGCLLLVCGFVMIRRQYQKRISELTKYLERVNTKKGGIILPAAEDDFSHLQDEIYKTVTSLYQTRDAALQARADFADNLANIAHQIKTPITAASISVQLLEQSIGKQQSMQIRRQLNRLATLEEALLLLSRIDAGTLELKREKIDIYTVLNLAADNLDEILKQAGVFVKIVNGACISIQGDLDWTMEAFMNLIKNCAEHSPIGSSIYCEYEANPLYAEVRIWDEGEGFQKEDLPHLFERFYRGKGAAGNGIGIGLSLAKAIFERENGHITAGNRTEGGACFEVRFYSH